MIIAVPVREGRFSSHFGGADAFALYTVDEASREVSEHGFHACGHHNGESSCGGHGHNE